MGIITDYHYLFSFHDEFIEVIAKGFWFEKDANTLFKRELTDGHPFLPLPQTIVKILEVEGIKYKVIFNPTSIDEIIQNIRFCQQTLIEFAIEFEEKFSINMSLMLMQRQGKLISVLRQFFGTTEFEKEGIATFEDVRPFIEKHIKEIVERRR